MNGDHVYDGTGRHRDDPPGGDDPSEWVAALRSGRAPSAMALQRRYRTFAWIPPVHAAGVHAARHAEHAAQPVRGWRKLLHAIRRSAR